MIALDISMPNLERIKEESKFKAFPIKGTKVEDKIITHLGIEHVIAIGFGAVSTLVEEGSGDIYLIKRAYSVETYREHHKRAWSGIPSERSSSALGGLCERSQIVDVKEYRLGSDVNKACKSYLEYLKHKNRELELITGALPFRL